MHRWLLSIMLHLWKGETLAMQNAEVSSATAQTEQARAQLVEAQANRQDLTIRAPFAATVITRAAEPGEFVPAGTAIVTLVDLTHVYLRGYVPEGQIETQLTQEGAVLGTPDYLAPEQAKDARSADIRADIYSVGCVLYHCIAGRPPFSDTNIMTQMVKHATEKPAPLSTFVENLPPGFQQVLDRFLAKSPGDRFQTPAEASAALKPFATDGLPVAGLNVVPAYQNWLVHESQMEMKTTQQGTATRSAVPASS